ncbi:Non-reducing polyketide synthase nscA [Dissostichus eleginoides]|uniref:Non-reducing polyketide synthase nscA n=1 Tax=Dissostichus eleginoides TaxID=100907 RepID=A0AAD9C5S3_DISEL|nr:Non-reducing polyketide synthase nscA [Dissostichus eleginoides]
MAAPILWCSTWTEMRECGEKEGGLLSIKFWYPVRQPHFIIINRLDGNWGYPPPVSLSLSLSPLSLSLSLCFPETLFAQVDSDTVFNGPQSPVPPPPSARMAVDCVIESGSGGACRELEVEAPTWVHSEWEGAGS